MGPINLAKIKTAHEKQAHQKRAVKQTTRRFRIDGIELTLSQISIKFGIKLRTLDYRLRKGDPIHLAIVPPSKRERRKYEYDGKSLTLEEWQGETGISWKTLTNRLQVGWSIEDTLTVPPGSVLGCKSWKRRGYLKTLPNRRRTGQSGSRDTVSKQTFFPENEL